MDTFYKFILGIITVAALLFAVNNSFADETVKQKPRPYDFLVGKHGNADIYITIKPCPIEPFAKKWKYLALMNNNKTGATKVGCYDRVEYPNPDNKQEMVEFIHIQWEAGDDPSTFSELPPNMFLQPYSFPQQKKEPALRPELEV
jgi:hypothetical protein